MAMPLRWMRSCYRMNAEPEDFTLEFVDKISITDSKIPARKEQNTFVFGTYVYAEACTISGDNGDIRDPNDIRPIWCEVDASFSPEGSTLPIDVWECQATFISEDSGTIGACKNGLTRLAAQTGQAGIDYISSLLRGKVKGPRKKYYRAERRRRARA